MWPLSHASTLTEIRQSAGRQSWAPSGTGPARPPSPWATTSVEDWRSTVCSGTPARCLAPPPPFLVKLLEITTFLCLSLFFHAEIPIYFASLLLPVILCFILNAYLILPFPVRSCHLYVLLLYVVIAVAAATLSIIPDLGLFLKHWFNWHLSAFIRTSTFWISYFQSDVSLSN